MDVIELARASGLQVILDGRIGREEYQSVCGSVDSLRRFADAISLSIEAPATAASSRGGDGLIAPRALSGELHAARSSD
ncbi:hypothetical protein [Paraburkholderia dioscoreae]|uniref:Uncharacterized protein n=1 Tax=Paraburkholderia dioscoreae TaxID=2604047 RepID=A0A5Q4YYC4_9BURK|nr:hypothetical protein [Paraburkholderia dioscoreae]VVD33744.1 protein of unknown function [Paraburkholderia dioscoreae]